MKCKGGVGVMMLLMFCFSTITNIPAYGQGEVIPTNGKRVTKETTKFSGVEDQRKSNFKKSSEYRRTK